MDDIKELVLKSIFEKDGDARKEIYKKAETEGIILASTYELYKQRAEDKWHGFTVPAVNIRTLTFDIARTILREARKNKVGAFIFELARSEMEYTDQSMSEYVSTILAASIKENYRGYLFFQGDHFQAVRKEFFSRNKEKEVNFLKNLIKESIEAGAYNIDIDGSTLVRLKEKDVKNQQRDNYLLTSELTSYIRGLDSKGITVSVGGEIGEIGVKNSTCEELEAFMKGYNEEKEKKGFNPGLSKISVQTGTSHGGLVDPSGKLIEPEIDFETLRKLSDEARKYGMGGAVQHGSSTLPEKCFDQFVKTGAVEIHLATAFQNIVFDSKYLPEELKEEMYDWLRKDFILRDEKSQTEEQFIYRKRKKALSKFKKEIWQIPQKNIDKICEELGEKISLIFSKLGVYNTVELIQEIYSK